MHGLILIIRLIYSIDCQCGLVSQDTYRDRVFINSATRPLIPAKMPGVTLIGVLLSCSPLLFVVVAIVPTEWVDLNGRSSVGLLRSRLGGPTVSPLECKESFSFFKTGIPVHEHSSLLLPLVLQLLNPYTEKITI